MMTAPAAVVGLEAQTVKSRQETTTLKKEMEKIHAHFGVNFVYDSSLDLDQPYTGKSLNLRTQRTDEQLREALLFLFADTGIEFEIMKKYVVLTKAGSKKKPRDYTILIEEQHDTINESIVTAQVDPKRNTTQTGLKRIDSKDINSGFALFSTPDVIKNEEKAVDLFLQAADAGDPFAMTRIGEMYENGVGVKQQKDLSKALHWYRRAST